MDVAITGEETSEKISETSGEEIGPKPSTLEEGVRESEPLAEKLKIIENVIDNQRRFVEDHEVKIDSLENIVAKISRQLEEREEALQTVGKIWCYTWHCSRLGLKLEFYMYSFGWGWSTNL